MFANIFKTAKAHIKGSTKYPKIDGIVTFKETKDGVLLTAKIYRSFLKPELVILLLFVLFSGIFCYARASLAMAVYFWGIGIHSWGKNLWNKAFGIVLAISSYFFHHEMIIGVAVLPCLLLPFEKKIQIQLIDSVCRHHRSYHFHQL